MKKTISKHGASIAIWGTLGVFTLLYLSLIFSHNIWTDEAFTIQLLENDLRGIIDGTAADVHPPLYYLYLKLFVFLFGDSLIAMKVASVIPLTGILVLGATKIRKLFGSMTAFLFLLFFTCIPCTMEFSVQLRMYSLAALCVTICGVYAYCFFMEGGVRNCLFIGISGVLAAYTHYFAFMSVIMIMLLLMAAVLIGNRKRLPAYLILGLCMVAAYLPWLPYFIHQIVSVNHGYWIPEISPESIWECFTWTFDLTPPPELFFCS